MQIKYYNDPDIEDTLLKLFEILDMEKRYQVLERMEHILENNGCPIPPNAKQLKWYEEEMNEIRIKFWNDLYRINYFIDSDCDYMVILNWYWKPDGRNSSDHYNKSKKKRLDKNIKLKIQEALNIKRNYFLNIWNYELFN